MASRCLLYFSICVYKQLPQLTKTHCTYYTSCIMLLACYQIHHHVHRADFVGVHLFKHLLHLLKCRPHGDVMRPALPDELFQREFVISQGRDAHWVFKTNFAYITNLTIVSLTWAVSICFSCFEFRQRRAPHNVYPCSLSLVLLEEAASHQAKIKKKPKVVIYGEGCHTHRNQVTASCNLNQNHGVAEEKSRENI